MSLLLLIHKRLSHAPPCILKASYSSHACSFHCSYNFFDVSNVSPLMQARCLPSSAHISIMCLATQSMDGQTFMLNDSGGNNSATTNALVKPHGLTINTSTGRVKVSCSSCGINRKNPFT